METIMRQSHSARGYVGQRIAELEEQERVTGRLSEEEKLELAVLEEVWEIGESIGWES